MTMHHAPAEPRQPFHAQPVPQWQMERIGVQIELANAVHEREPAGLGRAMAATYVDAGYCIDAPAYLPAGSCCGVYEQTLINREASHNE